MNVPLPILDGGLVEIDDQLPLLVEYAEIEAVGLRTHDDQVLSFARYRSFASGDVHQAELMLCQGINPARNRIECEIDAER